MRLIDDFKHVFPRLWSVRLAILAGLLSGVEVLLPLFPEIMPRGCFAAASFVVTLAAIVARAVAQPKLIPREECDDQAPADPGPGGRHG